MNSFPIFSLLPPFYDVTPYKDLKVCLNRIEEEFNIKIEKYHYDQYSFGNDVFIVNDTYVFRFPRTEHARNHFKYEIDFLEFLKDRATMKIPHYSFISKNHDFAGYKIIPGKPLSSTILKYMSRNNKEKAVNQLIKFVNSIHSISPNDFKKYKPALLREDFISIEKRIEEELEKKLFPKLSKTDIDTITSFYKESKTIMRNIPNMCPAHGDLYGYNVIWDKDTTQTGVIDFSDYFITDPARDFEIFYDFGPKYAQIAYGKYEGVKDNQFLQRAEIYYKLHGIYTLLSSLLGANISFDYAYKYFFKQKFNI